jgi:Mn2+/Fe2+ NRAMP family transporter
MGISRKDMLINVGLWVIGMIIILLIAFDPLDILDLNQKVIIVVIMTAVLLPLLLIRRKRLVKKLKEHLELTKNRCKMSLKMLLVKQ